MKHLALQTGFYAATSPRASAVEVNLGEVKQQVRERLMRS